MNIRIILKILFTISVVCLFSLNFSAQPSGGGAIMAIDEKPIAGGGRASAKSSSSLGPAVSQTARSNQTTKKTTAPNKKTTQPNKTQTTTKKIIPKSVKPKKYDGFIIGDDHTLFNFEIVKEVPPLHTIVAKEAGAKGLVQVEILIDVDGSVLEARARSGNKLLHPEAEKAALATKFRQFSVYGKPARAFGFIVFRFGRRED